MGLSLEKKGKPSQCDKGILQHKSVIDIKSHVCIHSGEKPLQSGICYKDEYLSKSNACLQEKKSHQECEYEYESQNTNKKFLRVHMCSHTGKKPFKCQNCEAQNRSHTC